MGKISLIIKREYITRVRKPVFIIMTILGPLLFGLITVAPVLLSQVSDEEKTIAVSDASMLYFSALKEKETEKIKFVYLPPGMMNKTLAELDKTSYYAVLDIPVTTQGDYTQIKKYTRLLSNKNVGLGVRSHIENVLTEEIRSRQLEASGIDKVLVDKTLQRVNIKSIEIGEDGKQKQKSAELNMAVGLTFGFLIYIFIFLYGAMVMRGVIEEKTSRIVEIIVSSVKPFQLMMGKIIGVGMVGLTQFVIWVILGLGITVGAQMLVVKDKYEAQQVAQNMSSANGAVDQGKIDDVDSHMESADAMQQILGLPFGKLLFCFLFYFLGGYLLYSSFFAAIGGAVDSETDSQQFMLPVTIPIIFSIIMMVRMPFDPPMWQVAVSMALLVVTFIFSTWIAGRIYRTGILMYGKKTSWKEIGKWLFYKG
jgi:ABC-2 type transport system permease protein